MKFSIIIPVYNLERYILKCLTSLINQDINNTDYEIIIVNDGSKDNSEIIIKKFISNHRNMSLFSIKNQGVSNARNYGLKKAKGEYVLFVDGDDWLNANVLKEVYNKLTSYNLEVAKFGYLKKYSNHTDVKIISQDRPNVITGLDYILETNADSFYPWQYFFSRKLLLEKKIFFNIKLSFSEDKEFLIRVLSLTNRFKDFKDIIYNYNLERDDAVSTKISDKNLKSLIDANYCIYKYSEANISTCKHRNIIKSNVLKSLRLSYYELTKDSLWSRFWIWNKNISPILKKIKLDNNHVLNLLKISPFIFYLKNYLPRAIVHKIKRRHV